MIRSVGRAVLPLLAGATFVTAQGPGPESPRSLTDHVVVISIDGLRPDAIEAFSMTNLQRMIREGSHSMEAKTVLPSNTLPSHASMLTGTTPDVHGLAFNRLMNEGPIVAVPTIFELARAEGLRTAAFYAKAKFRHLDRPDSYDHRQAPTSSMDNWPATRTVAAVEKYLERARPNLLFVHLAEPDYAGHTTGWMNAYYGWAVQRADSAVGRVLAAADAAFGAGEYTLIITADHGGHGREHGTEDDADSTIPWIAWGRGVHPGGLPAGIRTMDTAATVLRLLGVNLPAGMAGRAVTAALVTPAFLAEDPES